MTPARNSNKVSARQSRAALKCVLDSGYLSTSPKLEEFLRFVVTEEAEGRGDQINAHAIAVKALDRPPSFDPRTDPVVRVFAGRLRAALASYYDGPGSGDPVHISIPKGSYRPVFRRFATEKAERGTLSSILHGDARLVLSARSVYLLAGMLALAFVLAGAGAQYLLHTWRSDRNEAEAEFDGQAVPGDTAVVEFLPFEAGPDAPSIALVEGIRQQLIVDLSEFRSIRVRAAPGNTMAGSPADGPTASDYQVLGKVVSGAGSDQLLITVSDVKSDTPIWSEPIELPTNDAEYQHLLVTAVRSIVTQLASISGLLQTEAYRRLEERRASLGDVRTSEYECITDFYAYDRTKSQDLEASVHKCLAALTAAGSRNSTIWSSWALILYLDWTRDAGPGDRAGLDTALAAASRAIELDPTDASGHEYQAAILRSMGEFEAAVQASKTALALNPSKPDLYVHLGWHRMLVGDWDAGVELVREGVAMNPQAPGWMRIPLSIEAFQRDDYIEAQKQARAIIDSGDRRGIVLALAATIELKEMDTARGYFDDLRSGSHFSLDDPMREIRNLFPDPVVIRKYEDALAVPDFPLRPASRLAPQETFKFDPDTAAPR